MIAAFGLIALVAAGVAYFKVQDGYGSLQAFSEAQNVTLTYNDAGELVDRGTVEGSQAIMSLLTDDWKYPVVQSDFDPNDPLVNTASEYMYQMATVTYHTLHGSVQVTLPEDVEYNGEFFAAGTYDVPTEGRYWTGFDRMHPLEGPARALVWTGTAHALIAELGVGTVTATMLQMGVALAAAFGVLGLLGLIVGLGMIWVSRGDALIAVPDTVASIKEEKTAPAIA
ncbi:MAG: hypothetical protein A2Z12_02135 [Actinobacteria bacterium RBG_16_68_21]|nr:MAG: hypothetical protein A2Z12_02135 [Actinobacteria bacterium RBG_16_68_21]